MKINVNGEVKELEYTFNNGIDCSDDIIGNNEELSRDEEGTVVMTQDQFDWWQEAFEKMEEVDELIEEKQLTGEKLDSFYADTNNNDLGQQIDNQLSWLRELTK